MMKDLLILHDMVFPEETQDNPEGLTFADGTYLDWIEILDLLLKSFVTLNKFVFRNDYIVGLRDVREDSNHNSISRHLIYYDTDMEIMPKKYIEVLDSTSSNYYLNQIC